MKNIIAAILISIFVPSFLICQDKSPRVASGVIVKILTPKANRIVYYGIDGFGVRIFRVYDLSGSGSKKLLTLTKDKSNMSKSILDRLQALEFKLKPGLPVWSFDGSTVDIEIVRGMKKLHRRDLLKEFEYQKEAELLLECLRVDS